MRWGIRRFRNRDGTLTDAGKERYSSSADQSDETQSLRNKLHNAAVDNSDRVKMNPARMTDDELKRVVSRMRLEKEYKSLYAELHPKRFKKLKETVSDILASGAKTAANSLFSKAFSNKSEESKNKERLEAFKRNLRLDNIDADLSSYSPGEITAVNEYLTKLNMANTTLSSIRGRTT